MKEVSDEFWSAVDQLVTNHQVIIDRSRGSVHPRFPGDTYPLDYGYLEGTTSVDGGGIDVWLGSMGKGFIQGLFCTVDLFKRDVEIKLIIGCSDEEIETISSFMNNEKLKSILVKR